MNTPAAMARIARIMPRPAIAGTNVASPVRMSQMLNNRKPIFFVSFMGKILSYVYEVAAHNQSVSNIKRETVKKDDAISYGRRL